MGSWSFSPLHLGSSSFELTTEPLNSLATESSSSSTLGGGGKRGCERVKKVLGTFGSFRSKGTSL